MDEATGKAAECAALRAQYEADLNEARKAVVEASVRIYAAYLTACKLGSDPEVRRIRGEVKRLRGIWRNLGSSGHRLANGRNESPPRT